MHIAVGMIQSVYKNEVNVCIFQSDFGYDRVSGLTGIGIDRFFCICIIIYYYLSDIVYC